MLPVFQTFAPTPKNNTSTCTHITYTWNSTQHKPHLQNAHSQLILYLNRGNLIAIAIRENKME